MGLLLPISSHELCPEVLFGDSESATRRTAKRNDAMSPKRVFGVREVHAIAGPRPPRSERNA